MKPIERLVASGFAFLKQVGDEIIFENKFTGLLISYNVKTYQTKTI